MTRDEPRLADYLRPVREAIDRIDRYVEDIDEAAFLRNEMVQDAVIRNIEIIGEASHNIEDHYPRVRRRAPRIARGVRPPDAQCRGSRLLQGGLGDRPEDHSQRPVGPIRAAQEGARKPPAERRRQEEGLIGMPALENIAVACG